MSNATPHRVDKYACPGFDPETQACMRAECECEVADATEHRVANQPISLGFDASGDQHLLFADRNLHHKADSLCGCNPDAANAQNPYGDPPTAGVWAWYHHSFEDER